MTTKEQIDELKELSDNLDSRIKKLEEKPSKEVMPRSNIKFFEDIKRYSRLSVNKLYAGIPIHETSTTTNHLQGEIYITKIGSTSSICSYIDGVEKKVNLT